MRSAKWLLELTKALRDGTSCSRWRYVSSARHAVRGTEPGPETLQLEVSGQSLGYNPNLTNVRN